LLHCLKKCNCIYFFTKTVEYICNACGNFIVVLRCAVADKDLYTIELEASGAVGH